MRKAYIRRIVYFVIYISTWFTENEHGQNIQWKWSIERVLRRATKFIWSSPYKIFFITRRYWKPLKSFLVKDNSNENVCMKSSLRETRSSSTVNGFLLAVSKSELHFKFKKSFYVSHKSLGHSSVFFERLSTF